MVHQVTYLMYCRGMYVCMYVSLVQSPAKRLLSLTHTPQSQNFYMSHPYTHPKTSIPPTHLHPKTPVQSRHYFQTFCPTCIHTHFKIIKHWPVFGVWPVKGYGIIYNFTEGQKEVTDLFGSYCSLYLGILSLLAV